MMRAALILVGLSTLIIMEFKTPPRTTNTASEPLAQSTVGMSESRDTLTRADRLEITYVQYEPPTQAISSVEPMTPPDVRPIIPQQAPNKVAQRRPGANEKKVVVVKPKPRPKHPEPKKAAKTDRSKATIEIKACRPNAFDGLLKALNISPRCET
jgi:hypothetical protein